MNSSGPSTEPCGTPQKTVASWRQRRQHQTVTRDGWQAHRGRWYKRPPRCRGQPVWWSSWRWRLRTPCSWRAVMPSLWSACAGTLTAVVRSSQMRAGVAAACLTPAVRSPSRWLSGWISVGSWTSAACLVLASWVSAIMHSWGATILFCRIWISLHMYICNNHALQYWNSWIKTRSSATAEKKMGNTTRCGITKFRDAPLAQIHPIFSSVVLLACYSLCNNTLDEPLSNLMDY